DALDGIEFARGSPRSKWGSIRAALGHPKPFDLRYVAVGNEDCGHVNYRGNYLNFHDAIRFAFPDIKIISNCDASSSPLNHPADLFDFHIYTDSNGMFSKSTKFDLTPRSGPKVIPQTSSLKKNGTDINVILSSYSVTSLDLLI
ncbi:Alpha-L-arabinofuranosidase 2, partial [Mucuna pruriens]